MKLAFIGIGKVGFALAHNLQKAGHEITIAHDDDKSESVLKALEKNSAFRVMPIQEAIDHAEIVFLATPFRMNEEILKPLNLKNKVLVDCTNPVGPGLTHGMRSEISGSEKVQEWAAEAQVVKSYSIYGYENLENTRFPNETVLPAMMIAGNDAAAKAKVTQLNTDLGFHTVDVGGLGQALHLEHLTLLWVKMARANGHHPHFTWAYLER